MSTCDDDDRDERSDVALLSRMAQGDQQALQELYARYRGPYGVTYGVWSMMTPVSPMR
jgi:hypothetical protein